MPQIFLCYAKEDEDQVEEIYGRLQALGFQPWMAKMDGAPGQLGKDEIRRAVQAAEFFLIFLSNNSVAQQGYLQREYKLALDVLEEVPDKAIYILAVRFDNCAIPMPLRRLKYGWGTTYEVHDFEGIEDHIRGHLQPGLRFGATRSQLSYDEESAPVNFALHDQVHFSVTSPSLVFPGLPFLIDVWAHFWDDKNDILTQVREAMGNAEIRIKSKGPVRIARGIVLTVQLVLDGLTVEDAEDTLLWEGTLSNATFSVMVPSEAEPGTRRGRATVYNESFEIARVHFVVQVGSTAHQKNEALDVNFIPAKQYRKAFASYANADRDEVLARLQGIQKIIPCLDIFMDVLSLRSGQNWEQELGKIIPLQDVFYLFWSRNAKGSVWVEREWRYALASRGLDFIDPVPLVSPDEVPPPPELGSLHFNDWVLAFMRSKPDSLLQ